MIEIVNSEDFFGYMAYIYDRERPSYPKPNNENRKRP